MTGSVPRNGRARLGIDLRELRRPGTGIGRWIGNFLDAREALAPDIEVVGVGSYHKNVQSAIAWPGPLHGVKGLARVIAAERIGLWLSPYFKIPPVLPVKAISTVHDTIPATILHRKLSFTLRLRMNLKRADRVATVSEASRDDLVANWNVPPDKIIMARNAVSRHFRPETQSFDTRVLERNGLKWRDYILVVADDRPHKNIATLVEAFAGREMPPVAIVGTERQDLPMPLMRLRKLDDADLAVLYRHARFLIHPALQEGFGLPALEAMASGTAVALSNIPSHREIAGDAARYVEPLDVDGWRAVVESPPSPDGVLARAALFRAEETYAELWSEIRKSMKDEI